MTIAEFRAAIKQLAGGEYYAVGVEITEHTDGSINVEWKAYTPDRAWVSGCTPQSVIEAFAKSEAEEAIGQLGEP